MTELLFYVGTLLGTLLGGMLAGYGAARAGRALRSSAHPPPAGIVDVRPSPAELEVWHDLAREQQQTIGEWALDGCRDRARRALRRRS